MTVDSNEAPAPETESSASSPTDTSAAEPPPTSSEEQPTSATASAGEANESGGSTKESDRVKPRRDNFWLWALGILLLLSIELLVYGHNGQIEVCVGIDGVTDFSLKHQARTKETARKMPQCASRLNLGMYDKTEEQALEALTDACGRATMVNKGEIDNCLHRNNKWTRDVTKTQIAPWDRRLYRRILWLE
ncbi:MAG TPA: hypothetical protein VHM70_28860 [Polyangiaceae bacterium]|jgi:hypothetical protein|nr:hypothetical protein [Polyangiaceae bacterium]